jgi:hypothetical protein
MITTIIFSFDRPMQLQILLESIEKFDIVYQLEVNILYAFSGEEFEKAYEQVKEKYYNFNWINENWFPKRFVFPIFPMYWHNYYWWVKKRYNRWINSRFKPQLLSILSISKCKFVMFLTDDSLFYKNIEINPELLYKITLYPKYFSYSLRHGTNIVGGNYENFSDRITWQLISTDNNSEWSYPFSVDGHIYAKDEVMKILFRVLFKNPNTLEGNVACYVKEHKLFNSMVANRESCLVGFELNRVQQIINNHNLNINTTLMNNYFLNGYRLVLDFDKNKVDHFRPQVYSAQLINENKKVKLI